jgi:hypothetical protein
MRPLPNGHMVISRHRPNHANEVAVAHPVTDGTPLAIGDEVATMRDRGDGSFEIVDSYVHGVRAGSGPAQVATEDFRTGWDRTFTSRGGDA